MLIRNLTAEHVYLACGRTDMRKSIDGLATLVLSKFQLDPHQPALFLFCGRRKDRIKGLLWDETGFLLLYKRLENGQYQWPDTPEDLLEISEQQLRWLTEGLSISQPKARANRKIDSASALLMFFLRCSYIWIERSPMPDSFARCAWEQP
jgi:transposase